MKSINVRWTIAASAMVLALNAYAGDKDEKKVILPPENPPQRWSVSGGAAVSSIKATFQASPAAVTLLDPPGGIYNGTGENFYGNGTVGIGGPNNPGPGLTGFTGGTRTILNADESAETFRAANFGGPVSDTELSLGAYIKTAYDAFDWDSNTLHLSPFAQYTFTTSFNSGDVPASLDSVTYMTTTAGATTGHFLRYTPSSFQGVSYPFQVYSPFAGGVHSSVNIYMHTFTLGLDLTKDLSDRLHLVVSTGPTANLFETGMVSSVTGFPVLPMRSDDSTWRFGWMGQVGLSLDLNQSKTWFLEGSGNYHWVTPFTVSTPLSSAQIQASSWGAELGMGHKF